MSALPKEYWPVDARTHALLEKLRANADAACLRPDGRYDPDLRPSPLRHPGLHLDRYVAFSSERFQSFTQRDQAAQIDQITRIALPEDAAEILAVWDMLVNELPGEVVRWCQTTRTRLASHLARPTPLENGSCSLHRVFGFAYLYGESLKGLARAAARELGVDATERDRVLGGEGAGSVDVLDAWPSRWPKLERDVTTSLHSEYYKSEGHTAPGDWEGANPVSFLAIAARTEFRFALKTRPGARSDGELAKAWLTYGLQNLGVAAKTGAGYGYFEPESPCRGSAAQ